MPLAPFLLLASAAVPGTVDEKPAPPPNLLIVQTDEHHFGTLGCYGGGMFGGDDSLTPHLDSLAADGALASRFYATTPVCSPSRGALVSGLYPQATPVTNNNIPLDPRVTTFADVLQRAGYQTGYAGKWHLAGNPKPGWAVVADAPRRDFGFGDHRFLFNRGHWKQFEMTPAGPRIAPRNERGQPTYAVAGATEDDFSTDWLTDRAVDFVRDHADEPWCYYLSLPDPHGPNTVRAPYDRMYSEEQVVIPASLKPTAAQTPAWGGPSRGVNEKQLRRIMPEYFGMVRCVDDNVGRLLAVLDETGTADRTAVVFTSDHGDLCGEHGRLNKGVPFEGSARIPFLLRHPGVVPPGTRVEQPLGCVDFLPTILALMGVEHRVPAAGVDASAAFRGEAFEAPPAVFRSTSGGRPWLAAVSRTHKLVLSASDTPWLYDLVHDPAELTNVADAPAHAAARAALTQRLTDYARTHRDPYAAKVGLP